MKTLIFARKPKLPFEQSVQLTSLGDNFTLTLTGKVAKKPTEFALNIVCGDKILLHMNPRWTQGTTVFNTYDDQAGWGEEEYRDFPTLEPKEPFDIVVHRRNPKEFIIKVNDEEPFIFRQRYAESALSFERTVSVEKVEDGDIEVRHIAFEVDPPPPLYVESGGAVFGQPGGGSMVPPFGGTGYGDAPAPGGGAWAMPSAPPGGWMPPQ